MTHIFSVHSNLTYACALAIIQELNISTTAVLFIKRRNLEINSKDFNVISLNSIDRYNRYIKLVVIILTIIRIHLYSPFQKKTLYITHTSSVIERFFFYSFRKRVSYIEDGLVSYRRDVDEIYKLSPTKERYAYCFSSKCFPTFKHKTVFNLKDNLPIKGYSYFFSKDTTLPYHFLIIEAISIYNVVSIDEYNSILNKIISYITSQGVTKIYYKLHPDFAGPKGTIVLNLILELFSKFPNIEFKEVSSNVVLEFEYFNTNNIISYAILSTLIFYSYISGNRTYLLANNIDKKYTEFHYAIAQLEVFKDIPTLIL